MPSDSRFGSINSTETSLLPCTLSEGPAEGRLPGVCPLYCHGVSCMSLAPAGLLQALGGVVAVVDIRDGGEVRRPFPKTLPGPH